MERVGLIFNRLMDLRFQDLSERHCCLSSSVLEDLVPALVDTRLLIRRHGIVNQLLPDLVT